MNSILLLLFASSLYAGAPGTNDAGETFRNFENRNSAFTEIFRDEVNCCPETGSKIVNDPVELAMCRAIWNGAIEQGFIPVDFRIFSKDGKPKHFNVSFSGYVQPGETFETAKREGETCCVYGDIADWDNAKVTFSETVGYRKNVMTPAETVDTERMGVSRTSEVWANKWDREYIDLSEDEEEILNKAKATSAFTKDNYLYYLSKKKTEKISYSMEDYAFDSKKALAVWSNQAVKVLKTYKRNREDDSRGYVCLDIVLDMKVYKDWLRVNVDCPQYEQDYNHEHSYFLKRINKKWVVVYDPGNGDPRYDPWIPTKVDQKYPGIKSSDIPDALGFSNF